MKARVEEANKEITIVAGDVLLCPTPQMSHTEPAVPRFDIQDGATLDQLRHGHIDFDPCVQHVQHDENETCTSPTAATILPRTTPWRSCGAVARGTAREWALSRA